LITASNDFGIWPLLSITFFIYFDLNDSNA